LEPVVNKDIIKQHFDKLAPRRGKWFKRNYIYHEQIVEACRPFLNPGSRVLELGCSTGDLLGALSPSYAVGVDISPAMIEVAREKFPERFGEDAAFDGHAARINPQDDRSTLPPGHQQRDNQPEEKQVPEVLPPGRMNFRQQIGVKYHQGGLSGAFGSHRITAPWTRWGDTRNLPIAFWTLDQSHD